MQLSVGTLICALSAHQISSSYACKYCNAEHQQHGGDKVPLPLCLQSALLTTELPSFSVLTRRKSTYQSRARTLTSFAERF